MLIYGIIFMTLALIFYTWAVFSGRREGLHRKQLIIFGLGLIFDFLGTNQMSIFAAAYGKPPEWHNLTGVLSLAGMGFHFVLALLATALKKADAVNRTFHRVSLTIYTLWCAAFATGLVSGMIKTSQL